MAALETAFEKLTGRQPTDADVQRLYRIKNALRLGDNDALWLVLLALDYHVTLYEKFPDEIAKASTDVLSKFRATADATAEASAQAAKADLAKSVATVAHKVARDVVVKRKLQWATIAIVALVVFGWVMHEAGHRAGVGTAYKQVADMQSSATWAASPQGLARRLIWTVPYGLGDDGSDLAVVRAADAAWLNSHDGKIARTLSEKIPPGLGDDGSDLAVVRASDAAWLNSADGHQAQALSQAGTLHWGEWLSAVVDSGLLSEHPPDRNSCQERTVMGFKWSLIDTVDGVTYCNVWKGRVFFLMQE